MSCTKCTDSPLIKKSSDKNKSTPKPPNIICKFRTHRFREYLFAKKKDILHITNKKVNFPTLTYQRAVMGKWNFALRIHTEIWKSNFLITKMLVMIRFSRSWRHWIRNLLTEIQNNNLTTTENVKVMNRSMSKSGFFTCLYRFRSIVVFLMVLLIKYICISTFLTNSAAYIMAFFPPSWLCSHC